MLPFIVFVSLFAAFSLALPLAVEVLTHGRDNLLHRVSAQLREYLATVKLPRFQWDSSCALSPVTQAALHTVVGFTDTMALKLRTLVRGQQGYAGGDFDLWAQEAVTAGYSIGAPSFYQLGTIYLCKTPAGYEFASISHETGPEIVVDRNRFMKGESFHRDIADLASRFISIYTAEGPDRDCELVIRLQDRGARIPNAANMSSDKLWQVARTVIGTRPSRQETGLRFFSLCAALIVCIVAILVVPEVPELFDSGSIGEISAENFQITSGLETVVVASSDGGILAGGNDYRVGIWTGPPWGNHEIRRSGIRVGDYDNMAVSRDGRYLVCALVRAVSVWNTISGDRYASWRAYGPVDTMVFSPDGENIAVGAANGDVQEADLRGLTRGVVSLSSAIRTMAYSPDGTKLGVSTSNGSLSVLQADGQLRQVRSGDGQPVAQAMAFPQSGLIQVSISAGNTHDVVVWRANESGIQLHASEGLTEVAVSPDGRFVAAASANRRLFVWSTTGTRAASPAEIDGGRQPGARPYRLLFLRGATGEASVLYGQKIYSWRVAA